MSLAIIPSGPGTIELGANGPTPVEDAQVTPGAAIADDIRLLDHSRAAYRENAPDASEPRRIEPRTARERPRLVPSARPTMEVFHAIFRALDAYSRPVIGPAERELFAVPLHDDDGNVTGGLWASTMFRWLNVELLFVPESLRGRGVGSALIAAAETEAMRRNCLGAFVDTASFQSPGFYQRLGYTLYGRLGDFPPGHERLYFRKLFGAAA